MKDITNLLTEQQAGELALFYEQKSFKAFKRLIEFERLELAKDAINQTDITQVRYLAGQAEGLKRLVKTIEHINKMKNKES